MKIVSTINEVREQVKEWKKEGNTIGFVPTMGYLHEGHASLIDAARKNNGKVVVSIFVNPIQFGPNEDLDSYPRDLEHDAKLCEEHGVDLIFHPTPEEMYGDNFYTFVDMDVLTKELCGLSRPDNAYFGQKDAQQLAIIKRMVKDLNMPLSIHGCPIIREEDGLAKSSRNTYLSPEERKAALVLSRSVFLGEKMVKEGERNCKKVIAAMTEEIEKEPLAKIDYVKIVDLSTMQQIDTIEHGILAAMAVYIGKTRLIDNFMLKGKIHRATVTQAELDYVGSITVDIQLLEDAGIFEYEKVQIVDVNNGARFETYTIAGERGSGVICLNGAAARMVQTNDKVIIMAYADVTPEEAKQQKPVVVFVDENNHTTEITNYERHGEISAIR